MDNFNRSRLTTLIKNEDMSAVKLETSDLMDNFNRSLATTLIKNEDKPVMTATDATDTESSPATQ
jgi:hypothetical protein